MLGIGKTDIKACSTGKPIRKLKTIAGANKSQDTLATAKRVHLNSTPQQERPNLTPNAKLNLHRVLHHRKPGQNGIISIVAAKLILDQPAQKGIFKRLKLHPNIRA